jgi:hypothetical protein
MRRRPRPELKNAAIQAAFPKAASEVEAGDRIRESGARRHRSGVIEVRPILEQFVSLRQIAKVQNRTILLEKGEIADRGG